MGYKENLRQVFYSQMSDGYSAEELDKTIKETTGMSMDAYLDAYLKEQIEQMSQTLKDGVLKNPEETGVYVEDGDRVQLTPQGEASVSCRFTVSGDTLTVEMQQIFFDRSFLKILIADNQISNFNCMFFFHIKSPLHNCFRSCRFYGHPEH